MKAQKAAVLVLCFALTTLLAGVEVASAAEHRLGGGIRYFRTIDDLDDEGFDDIEDSGSAWVASYQYVPRGLLRYELNIEYFPDGFGGSNDEAISPQAFVLIGKGLYGGVGIGGTYSSDFKDDLSDPFYLARIGFDLELIPSVFVDINATYQAGSFNDLDQADTDSITLGAIARFAF